MEFSKFLFWGFIAIVSLFLLVNLSVDSNEFFEDDKTSNMLYCGYEKFDLSVSCNETSDCIDFEVEEWNVKKRKEWDIVDGSGNLSDNFNKMFNECIYCSDNKCLSGITIRRVNY